MKAQDVFDAIDQLKPNDFNRSEKRGWLKQLEQMILREIIIPHGGTVEDVELTERGDGHAAVGDAGRRGAVHEPGGVFRRLRRRERRGAAYNNSITAFNAAYQAFSNWYNRTHMPLGEAVKYW